jgi:hypothetical protein
MSVARPELKTIEQLREWIDTHAGSSGVPDQEETAYVIVRRAPTSGQAGWNVVADTPKDDARARWSSARRHAIRTARLLFDLG